jgi:hypothetical protein
MKIVSLLFILILSASCGQGGGGGSSSSSPRAQNQDESCNFEGREVACANIEGTDGEGVDLLETMIDVPVQMSGSEMTFMADKTATSQGRRLSCKASVKNGEIYRYALRGDTLIVMSSEGTYEMERMTDGSTINSTWSWHGYEEAGTRIARQLTIVDSNRVIMRKTCEL